jgi:hypothetical protein
LRLAGACVLGAVVSSACFGGAAAPTPGPTSAPTAAPVVSPVPTKPAVVASPSPVAKPTATTAAAAAVEKVWVGNTDGEGVFVRKTPVMADRVKAYPDKTVLTIVGEDVDGDGQKWHHVRTPDGVDGYVPVQYTVTTEP